MAKNQCPTKNHSGDHSFILTLWLGTALLPLALSLGCTSKGSLTSGSQESEPTPSQKVVLKLESSETTISVDEGSAVVFLISQSRSRTKSTDLRLKVSSTRSDIANFFPDLTLIDPSHGYQNISVVANQVYLNLTLSSRHHPVYTGDLDFDLEFEVSDQEVEAQLPPLHLTLREKDSPAVSFSWHLPFQAGTEGSYSVFDANYAELVSGVFRLKNSDQIDDEDGPSGFGGGNLSGVQWDSSLSALRLSSNTNNASLSSDWTPKWNNIVWYWKMDGSGAIPTTSFSVDKGGTNCNAGSSGLSYASAQVGSGAGINRSVSSINCAGAAVNSISNNITLGGWIKHQDGTPQAWAETFTNSSGSSTFLILVRNSTTRNLYLRIDTDAQTNASCGFSTMPAIDGNWHYVTYTLSSGTVKAYLDGNLVQTCTYLHGLGFASTSPSFYLKGLANGQISYLDDWAVWNAVLTDREIELIHSRQSMKYSGFLLSRVMDGLSPQPWSNFATTTNLPYGKELPGQAGSESSSAYSDIAPNVMTGIQGYWKLNETAFGTTPGGKDFLDSSGNAQHAWATNTSNITLAKPGKFSRSVELNNTQIQPPSTVRTWGGAFSISLWFRTKDNSLTEQMLASAGNWNSNGFRLGLTSWSGVTFWTTENAGNIGLDSNYLPSSNKWHHVVATFTPTAGNNGDAKLYINGELKVSATGSFINPPDGITFGEGGTGWPFYGNMDEVALWGRTLSDSEVLQLFRRGSNRILYQVRSCDSADCTDQDSGSSQNGWLGPDGSAYTYFSELTNNTSLNSSAEPIGNVNLAYPNFVFSNFAGIGLNVPSKRYFQYRAILESDDRVGLCNYTGSSQACSPELSSVEVGPNHYPTTEVAISNKSSLSLSFETLSSLGFHEQLGSAGCSEGIKYSLSPDGSNYYYWNGSSWSFSSGAYATSSSADDLSLNLGSFVSSASKGNLFLKAVLKSNGLTPCELDSISLDGTRIQEE